MEFIKKIINKIKTFFKNRTQKLLVEINENKDDIDFKNETIEIDSEEILDEFTQIDMINIDYLDRKKEFFETYQKFKDGKIKKEHLLITDLIDFEMMMLQEENILKAKIEKESNKIKGNKLR